VDGESHSGGVGGGIWQDEEDIERPQSLRESGAGSRRTDTSWLYIQRH